MEGKEVIFEEISGNENMMQPPPKLQEKKKKKKRRKKTEYEKLQEHIKYVQEHMLWMEKQREEQQQRWKEISLKGQLLLEAIEECKQNRLAFKLLQRERERQEQEQEQEQVQEQEQEHVREEEPQPRAGKSCLNGFNRLPIGSAQPQQQQQEQEHEQEHVPNEEQQQENEQELVHYGDQQQEPRFTFLSLSGFITNWIMSKHGWAKIKND